MEKFLYFRTEATIGDDDATGDSALYPLSSFLGAEPTADSTLTLRFKNMVRTHGFPGPHDGDSNVTAVFNQADSVQLTLTAANTHKDALAEIMDKINSSRRAMITIGDDLTGNTEYITDKINAVATISVLPVFVAS
jgi:hypothetical protein